MDFLCGIDYGLLETLPLGAPRRETTGFPKNTSPDFAVLDQMKLPRPYGRGIFSPRFVGSGIPPKRKTLRSHPRAYARGISRRGIKVPESQHYTLCLGWFGLKKP